MWSSQIVCVIIPYNGPESSLEADLHVQWVGTLEIDIDDDVPDNEISGQGEVVSVDGMSSIVLWHKKMKAHMFMQMSVGVSQTQICLNP